MTKGCRRMRSGFALLLTLAVLAVVIVLTLAALRQVDAARMLADEAAVRVEANILYDNMKDIFARMKQNKAFRKVIYTTPVPIRQRDVVAMLTCRPLVDSLNINWLAYDGNATYQANADAVKSVMENVLYYYEAQYADRFMRMLMQHIAPLQNGERQSSFSKKYGKITFRQFEEMAERYELETQDHFVERVPWEEIFVFEPLQEGSVPRKIASDYMKKQGIVFFFNIEDSVVNEMWKPGEETLSNFLEQAGADKPDKALFADGEPKASFCRVELQYKSRQLNFSFKEIEGEVSHFVKE